jgi:hypothetical protein
VKRSAVLKDVPHNDLESGLGNWLETGWTVKQVIPSSQLHQPVGTAPAGGVTSIQVTHYTVFIEQEYDRVGGAA